MEPRVGWEKGVFVSATGADGTFVELLAEEAGMTRAGEVVDDTELGLNARSRFASLGDWGVEGTYYFEPTDEAAQIMHNAWRTGQRVWVQYEPVEGGGYRGQATVEELTLDGDVTGEEVVMFALRGIGNLTLIGITIEPAWMDTDGREDNDSWPDTLTVGDEANGGEAIIDLLIQPHFAVEMTV